MLEGDHLTLRLNRLKPSEQWLNQGAGICFVFSKGGAGSYVSKAATHRLASGDILVLNAATGGKLSADAKGDFLFKSFSLVFEHLLPLFSSNEISLLQNVVDNFKAVKIYVGNTPLAQDCHQLLEGVSPQFNLEHRSQLLRIAAAILSVEFKNAQSQRSGGFVRAEDHMIHVFEKLSSTELLSLSVGELAAKFSCSRRHLNRLFHDHFGVSVAALRMEMRLLKAISLLRDPQVKIINVAEQCGFNHLGLFNTCFKRRYGASPGQWRKSQSGTEVPAADKATGAQSCPLQAKGICPWSGRPEVSGVAGKGTVVVRTKNVAGSFARRGADGQIKKFSNNDTPNTVYGSNAHP